MPNSDADKAHPAGFRHFPAGGHDARCGVVADIYASQCMPSTLGQCIAYGTGLVMRYSHETCGIGIVVASRTRLEDRPGRR